ncbi:hypothetical protein HZB94_02145 [Candidatus Falkowbacteria bacterium]|nr:hypothetical protein [Candidatus Falkowbacteria bacterium]
MTKTRSKTKVKLAVATAGLVIAAAAALMINTESGTDNQAVAFCQNYDKGIVIQEQANDSLQTLVNGCQKSGWGMSDVNYTCDDPSGSSSDEGKGGKGGFLHAYETKWKPCVGGAVEVENGPSLIISTAADTPAANNFSLGDKDLTLASFSFSSNPNAAEPANLKISELVISINSSGPRTCLTNFRLVGEMNNNLAAPVAAVDAKKKTTDYSSSVVFSNISDFDINTEVKRTLFVIADVSDQKLCAGKAVKLAILPDYSSEVGVQMPVKAINLDAEKGGILGEKDIMYLPNIGKAPLSNLKQGSGSQLKTFIFGVNANEFVFYTTKLLTSLSADSPEGTFTPSANTTIGKFKVCNSAKDATVQYMDFGLYPYVQEGSPNDVKIKIKVDDPASSEVFLEKEMDFYKEIAPQFGKTAFKDADFKNVMIASGTCKEFRVTMDTTKLKMTQFGVARVVWADSLNHNIVANGNQLPTPYKALFKN